MSIISWRSPKWSQGQAYSEGVDHHISRGLLRPLMAASFAVPIRYPGTAGVFPRDNMADAVTVQLGLILPLVYRGQMVDYGAQVNALAQRLGTKPQWLGQGQPLMNLRK